MQHTHPGWEVEIKELDTGYFELFVPEAKLILLDRWAVRASHKYLLAHAVAHLSIHRDHLSGTFSRQQEQEADWLADLWTGRTTAEQ